MSEEKKESNFWKYFSIVVVTFIVTALLLFGVLAYYVMAKNPFNVQACIISSFLNVGSVDESAELGNTVSGTSDNAPQKIEPKYDHPLLSETQEVMLEKSGIDVGALPTTISPETEKCFVDLFGVERVGEIKAGATPGMLEMLKGKSCL